jgi:hypothetical protein
MSLVSALRGNDVKWSLSARMAVLVSVLVFAVLLLRPHEEAFQGLDESAFRLMASSIEASRPLKSIDETLKGVPLELRKNFLYRSLWAEQRMTRDQSFQIEALDSCQTKPFYYPLLPLSMVGFDVLVPGRMADYMVPLAGFLFSIACIAVGVSYGRWVGGVMAAVFLVGSPLPAWLFRGCFPESIGGILLALMVLSWTIRKPCTVVAQCLMFVSLGLAVSFHLALIVIAVPLAGILILETGDKLWRFLLFSLSFVVGLLPVILMTVLVATPYGALNWDNIKYSIANSASIRSSAICAGALLVVILAVIARRAVFLEKMVHLSERRYLSSVLMTVLGVTPILLSAFFWSQGKLVQRGVEELIEGWRLPFGLFMFGSCAYVLFSKHTARAKVALVTVCLSLPVFLYLKGADQVGLWSQRRLLPSFMCIISCCIPAGAALIGRIEDKDMLKKSRPIIAVILLVMGLSNAVRWPAPYLVRSEYGSDAWVTRLSASFDNKLVVFDYHPYSVPFAVKGKGRFLGLGEDGAKELSGICRWLADKAGKEEVLLASAYENPGLEEGCILEEVGRESIVLDRVRSKAALPAVLKKKVVGVKILRVRPMSGIGPLVIDKVFDGGPLGLRDPWGRSDKTIKCSDGRELLACWSRQGSGIVGPLPRSGQAVRITLEAAARRKDELTYQTLQFVPPWGGDGLSLLVSNDYTKVSGTLARPADSVAGGQESGVYRIRTPTPYSADKVGIKGFGDHLGALIHRIRIEIVPANPTPAAPQRADL